MKAQVSVWDGTAEPWTHGSGTQEDPYLIESAAQFAYLQNHTAPFRYFKLMTDIDLDNRDWFPIGYNSLTYAPFHGCFDGNDHTIYHLTTTLFCNVEEGCIKNLTVRDSDIVVDYGLNSFSSIACTVPMIENCHNYGNVILNYEEGNDYLSWTMGGVAGECGTVKGCSNHGNLIANTESIIGYMKIGGVVGRAHMVEKSYNTGDIIVDSEISSFCYVGGICGEILERVSYCYNTVDMLVNNDIAYVGGIAGSFYTNPDYDVDTLVIASCYNSGYINGDNAGGILAKNDYDIVVDCNHSYYINTIASINDYGTPISEEEMKSQDFVNLLNNGGVVYAMDDMMTNHGFPIFAQYYFVSENEANHSIAIYPNPAGNFVNISFENKSACKSVEIYSLDGRIVKTIQETFQETSLQQMTLDISSLISGVYIMKVTMADGSVISYRIIKE